MIDAFDVKLNVDLVDLISRDTRLIRVADTGGGEYAGACPFCGGKDRFKVQRNAPPGKKPSGPRWMCRQCGDKWGDAIGYIQKRENLDFIDALNWLAEHYRIQPNNTQRTPPPKEENLNEYDLGAFHLS